MSGAQLRDDIGEHFLRLLAQTSFLLSMSRTKSIESSS
jgi:hypothetical protein